MRVSLTASTMLLLPAALQAWLAVILIRRGLHRSFRFFFFYTAVAVAALLLRFAVQGNYSAYFYTYWVSEVFYAVLGLLAILEVFPQVFKSFILASRFRLVIWIAIVIMILLAVVHAIFMPMIQGGRLTRVIYPLEIGVQYVQVGVFVVLVGLAGFFRIALRRYAFGIVFGFGLLAAASLSAALLRSDFGTRFKFLFTFMPGVVYIIAVLIWLLTFLRPEPPDPTDELKSPMRPEEIIERVRRLSRILKGRRDDINLLASAARRTGGSRVRRCPTSARLPAAYDY